MKKTISLLEATKELMRDVHKKPVITTYDLYCYLLRLYQDKTFDGVKIRGVSLDAPEQITFDNIISSLQKSGFIHKVEGLDAYYLSGVEKPTTQQILCTVLPFSYISHLSAMEWHGITDRIPSVVHVTICSNKEFKSLERNKISSELGGASVGKSFSFQRKLSVNDVNGKLINFHEMKCFTPQKEIYGTGGVRVSSIGHTFLSMLQHPEWCGGFSHVYDVFCENAEKHKAVIIRELDKSGNKIDRSRAGYIMDEVLGIKHPAIDKWKLEVMRGGSRKLSPENDFSPNYSEVWCLSLNL